MEFEKTALITAPVEQVWAMLLDPNVMAACVPGMESIQVVTPTEYIVTIQVKISFITARFKMNTAVMEARAPTYLRSDGAGEDSTLTSSLKMSSEVFLDDRGDGTMQLRMKLKVEVFGRLGGFGLNIIKTKADRMWEEFGRNLAARISREDAGVPAVRS
jgi:uncharacterized protein